MSLIDLVQRVPLGYTTVQYDGRTYGLQRQNFNNGKSVKVFAQELGGTDFISFNFYQTSQGGQLKPCEMPAPKVLAFLRAFTLKKVKK
ncbi:MAG: peptide methionine sulfoxide reductase [Bacteroidota bacterium]